MIYQKAAQQPLQISRSERCETPIGGWYINERKAKHFLESVFKQISRSERCETPIGGWYIETHLSEKT